MSDFKVEFREALKHKWVKYGLYVIAAIGVVIVVKRMTGGGAAGSSGISPATGLSDAQAADQTQLALQANQIAAAEQSQQAQISAASSAQQNQNATALSALQIEYGTQLQETHDTNQTNIALAGVQLQGLQAQLAAQTTQQQNANQTQVALENARDTAMTEITQSQTQAQIAALNAQETLAAQNSANQLAAEQSSNQAQVAIAQAQSGGGGGCFITTATCEAQNLPDNCDELQTLRWFRDAVMSHKESGRAMVGIYYALAPLIVRRLDALDAETRSLAYAQLYVLVKIAVRQVETGFYDSALNTYITMLHVAADFACGRKLAASSIQH